MAHTQRAAVQVQSQAVRSHVQALQRSLQVLQADETGQREILRQLDTACDTIYELLDSWDGALFHDAIIPDGDYVIDFGHTAYLAVIAHGRCQTWRRSLVTPPTRPCPNGVDTAVLDAIEAVGHTIPDEELTVGVRYAEES